MRALAAGMMLGLLGGQLAGQNGSVTLRPLRPTVGDTVVATRFVPTHAGWRVRAGKFEPTETVDALAEPVVQRDSGGWQVTYLLVAWAPGAHVVALPPVWRLGPDGTTDSVPGMDVGLNVRSVLPEGDLHPAPEPALSPIARSIHRPWAPITAGLLAATLGAALVFWRRRPLRRLPAARAPARAARVPDASWLAAGEPRAVAARATDELRAALARAQPRAAIALSTVECLTVLEGRLPRATLGELTDVLAQLDRVAFASAHGGDVGAIAGRARALAKALK